MKLLSVFFVVIVSFSSITSSMAGETFDVCVPVDSLLTTNSPQHSETKMDVAKTIVEKVSLVTPQVIQIGKLLLHKKNGVSLYVPVLLITLGSGVLGITALSAIATSTVGTLGLIESDPLTDWQAIGAAIGIGLTLVAIGSTIFLAGVGFCIYRAK